MEWKRSNWDIILVPLGLLLTSFYHVFLWYRVKKQPLKTIIGINSAGRRLWVESMMKENNKKNVLAVQTLRNSIMGSTLMATTAILLSCGLAAITSSTYAIKKPLEHTAYGSRTQYTEAVKYVSMLAFFLFSFLCHSLSIRYANQVIYLINIPLAVANQVSFIDVDYVYAVLERGFVFNTIGNRVFYIAFPLLLWIYGPVPMFVGSAVLVPILYNTDFICFSAKTARKEEVEGVEEIMGKVYPMV